MKRTLMLLLYVTLGLATPLEITNHMPTALVLRSTPPAQNFDNGISEHPDSGNEDQGPIIEESAENNTEENIVKPDSVEDGDDNVNEKPKPSVEDEDDNVNEKPKPSIEDEDDNVNEEPKPSGESEEGTTQNSTTEGPIASTKSSSELDSPENEEKSSETGDDQIVNTTYGLVQGVRKPGNTIHYFDIPYGRFSNKFEAPTAPESWTTVLENTNHTVKCPQLDGDAYTGDLNCLTLSVFTRDNIVNASVLFYIHESDFSAGSGDPGIYNPQGLVNRNVILVLSNYRLGPLGFLCLQNSTAPGNAALKDLTLALEWTTNNIRKFGGDPSNIAVSGDGASAALAGYLALAPRSRGFISKVITDSGSALSHWAIDRNPIVSAKRLAELIRSNVEENMLCGDLFREVDVETLVKSAKGTKLGPCIEKSAEGSFITVTPWKILDSQEIDLSFIIGTANHAGLLDALDHDEDSISELNEHFSNILPNDLSFHSTLEMNNIGETLKAHYFGRDNITLDQSKELSLYHTDASYLGPNLRVARALVNAGASVFLYEFSFVGALNKNLVSLKDPPEYGAVRGDIVGYLFPPNILQDASMLKEETNLSEAEKRIVDLMADLWVSFLETGEPSADGIVWRPLNATTDVIEDYLCIGNDTFSANGIHPERLRVWTEIYRLHFVDRNTGVRIAVGHYWIAIAVVFMSISKVFVG